MNANKNNQPEVYDICIRSGGREIGKSYYHDWFLKKCRERRITNK